MVMCFWYGLFDCANFFLTFDQLLGAPAETLFRRIFSIVFCWVHLFGFFWVSLINCHPWRFCMVYRTLLSDVLVMLWLYHPWMSWWGGFFSKIFYMDINASLCTFHSVNIRLVGAEFCIALIKYCAAWMTSSGDHIFGMLNFLEKNSTVSEIRSALVFGMYYLWHM